MAVRNKQYDHTTVNAATGTTELWVIALFGHISAAHMCPQPPVVKNLTRIGSMILAVADRFLTVQGALRTKTVRRHGWHRIGGTMNVETAQRLADLRRSKGFSQEGLARKLGLSRQAVSKWERAESSPDTENLISLAKHHTCILVVNILHDRRDLRIWMSCSIRAMRSRTISSLRTRTAPVSARPRRRSVPVPTRRRHALPRRQRRRVMLRPRRRKRQAGVHRPPMPLRRRRRVAVRLARLR